MKAMIMAAGVGSRLMPLTINVPKPMVPMANQPLMENTVRLMAKQGFNELIANLHYHGDKIQDYFGDGSRFGVDIAYSPEEELWGTAGGVKRCQWFLNETFAVVSGDALTDIDAAALLVQHKARGALATIALKEVDDVEHFGVVVTGEDGRIERFQEKPRPEEALSHLANTGIYIFEPEIFNYIPAHQFYDFGKQVFPQLVKMGAPFYGVAVDNYWCDVGSLNTYRQAHLDILKGLMQVTASGKRLEMNNGATVLLGPGAVVSDKVNFKGKNVIGPGCRIEDHVDIENSVLWDNCIIGAGTVICEAVLGSSCRIGPESTLSQGAVLASDCELSSKSMIPKGARVFCSHSGDLQAEI
ncbi:sugar phosphate nucleotidyltransferase [Syntrophomonas palmitatica]|uniref:sugar phosphate nucleotidyltransferase n=1 Tax=Syntrophomonas palmitatica TaxID=402877 RepID=UPI0006D0588E|nr:NDP-sugar synthase [Syntrophomonas palmitatica]